ncbi:MAG TPA: hypothetical protein VNH15_04080 [Elusimicrobiota bacterium]|nr:hypothetical protein [Elusimicrobiota bacterium]
MRRILGAALMLALPGLAMAALSSSGTIAAPHVAISPAEALSAGRKIWVNECGGTIPGLTHWNKGEAFASLGIGHFIWYPAGERGPFVESFPELLAFLRANHAFIPKWLLAARHCPWQNRAEFLKDSDSPRMKSLRDFLARTVDLQAMFMAERLEKALPIMLQSLPTARRAPVLAQFDRVARSPGGIYPLMDYVNFKGEGTALSERYKGQGWGLLQVLEEMKGSGSGPAALAEFSRAADFVLERRVRDSPHPKHDAAWLPVWRRRVAGYAD